MNVVSTSPSSTEILYELGVEPVAVSHACDHPPAAAELPAIDVSKVDATASADRHEQVRAATANGHLYRMDGARIDALEPDLIVTQGVCGVCAVDDVLVEETLADLEADPDVLALQANRLADVLECVEDVGRATGTEERAAALVDDLRERIAAVEERVPDEPRPRTAVLEWMDPIRPAGSWVPDVVDAAGGEYGIGEPGERSRPLEWDAFLEYDPEVLVVAPCGFDADRTLEQFHELSDRPGWDEIAAVRDDRVFVLDGSAYLTRWTPRLVDAVERLAALCHPQAFELPADVVRP
ncbi:ABC transporter substrate-binding protein [Natrarchaeobius oligotrophus]|uniref:Cobalamin-binding protein n=1 Tax=Natrarchaeobius chitinivorans TaxID=1679083 RepID=A0A3N6PJ11_NATCH|nr:ABC transporter substrate-binding protein [Natrarchaeobius chitinivorans]RQH00980.1 cobalamin-binding protein [Natrarchaeobius chitinivorans]